ncbi:acyltransferase family protein [Paenibacillus sp. GCM10023248]|uniref:acyltransferase family protein n=1 Tax=unclassified Paenibacillus TaxID=185978 RepID=UPI00237919F4|nr:acyltransferase [Paenibacillus sp. MAHUQ-63]MDD9266522.1 acyltransferase [Paenibacillus sp. MAHUQ-63]
MLKSLTSFRFFAAFMVYLYHSVGLFKNFQFGYIGVSFFFVLSGFILAYNYHSKFTELNKTTIQNFYIARLAKVYPVHLLTLGLSIPYVLLISARTLDRDFFTGLFANLLMIQSFFPLPFGTMPYSFNSVSWSLSDELFFYIMFPFVVYLLQKLKINTGALKILIIILAFICMIFLTTFSTLYREAKLDDWYYYVFPIFRAFDFVIGILVGMLFATKKVQENHINKSLFNLLEIFSLCLLVVWISLSPYISQVFRFSIYYVPMWCILIYIFAYQGGFVSKALSNRLFVLLGEASFSFYMIHLLVINYVGVYPMGSLLNHLITFFGSILLSILIYLIYEEPLRKKIRFGAKNKEKLQYQTFMNNTSSLK